MDQDEPDHRGQEQGDQPEKCPKERQGQSGQGRESQRNQGGEPIKAAAWKVEVRLPDGQRDWEEIGSVSPPRESCRDLDAGEGIEI